MSPDAIGAVWLFALWACTAYGWWRTARRERRRRGGYVKLSASTFTNPETGITEVTPIQAGSNSLIRPGMQWVDAHGRLMRLSTSSYAADLDSGNGTGGDRGPQPRDSADLDEWSAGMKRTAEEGKLYPRDSAGSDDTGCAVCNPRISARIIEAAPLSSEASGEPD